MVERNGLRTAVDAQEVIRTMSGMNEGQGAASFFISAANWEEEKLQEETKDCELGVLKENTYRQNRPA